MGNVWKLADFGAVVLMLLIGFLLIMGNTADADKAQMLQVAVAVVVYLFARIIAVGAIEEHNAAETRRSQEQPNQSNANASQKDEQEEDRTPGSGIDSD